MKKPCDFVPVPYMSPNRQKNFRVYALGFVGCMNLNILGRFRAEGFRA